MSNSEIHPSIIHWYKVVITYTDNEKEKHLFTTFNEACVFYTLIKGLNLKRFKCVEIKMIRIGED